MVNKAIELNKSAIQTLIDRLQARYDFHWASHVPSPSIRIAGI